MSNSNNPTPLPTDPFHGVSKEEKDVANALILMSQGPAKASSSDKGKGVADPDLSDSDSELSDPPDDLSEPAGDAVGDDSGEQQAGQSSTSAICSSCGKPRPARIEARPLME
ncbi:uncharacterized protein NECHADRAFT_82576 [Fusarium vanettenii 77-13-4]|uniref:Uncharacterized protein n=1 Tax=Fusarium vanettenii (strain ATCC MYA-4622 / CBS 123669 / FGSC 9596 / NRRL 45880 / 77-13-4) TaxID=660122 RepID=C7YXL9_FUSV7|nr:uncharacterized protein NECHADRAFT_82576 [Fusarium vanettenii 77-13-4]EEU43608.1 predicted protein [Fusarium vanettenii 77-13-4]